MGAPRQQHSTGLHSILDAALPPRQTAPTANERHPHEKTLFLSRRPQCNNHTPYTTTILLCRNITRKYTNRRFFVKCMYVCALRLGENLEVHHHAGITVSENVTVRHSFRGKSRKNEEKNEHKTNKNGRKTKKSEGGDTADGQHGKRDNEGTEARRQG